MKFVFVFAMVLSCGVSLPAFAHSGLTNANGCHTDNDGSNYHCHEDRRRAGVEIASSPLFEPEEADIGASTTRPATIQEVQELNADLSRRLARVDAVKTFDDSAAMSAVLVSMGVIGLTSVIGSVAARNKINDPFLTIALPSLSAGLLSSSVFGLQVGLGSKTRFTGAVLVGLNAIAPLILGLSH